MRKWPAGWSSALQGIDDLPTHADSLGLVERTTVVGSAEVAPLAPRLTVTLVDGTTYRLQMTGDELKLGFDDDTGVVRTLAPEVLGGADQIERLIAAVFELDDA